MEAYEAGQIGEKTALELKGAEFAGKLTTGQREVVYNRGSGWRISRPTSGSRT